MVWRRTSAKGWPLGDKFGCLTSHLNSPLSQAGPQAAVAMGRSAPKD